MSSTLKPDTQMVGKLKINCMWDYPSIANKPFQFYDPTVANAITNKGNELVHQLSRDINVL